MRRLISKKSEGGLALATAAIFFNGLVASSALADNRTVACFVLPKDDSQVQAAAVMASIVRAEMARLSGITVRTGAGVGNPDAAVEAERLVRQGFEALNTGDKTTALTRFERAFDVLAQNPGVGEVALHAKVAKGLGVANLLNGNTTKATEFIKRSMMLYPDQSAAEYAYSIDVKNVYDFARRDISERQPGNIEVRSTPDSAEVYLDGVFKGYTPITLSAVPAGSHLVEVARDGYLRWGTTALVPEAGRVATEAPLTASPNKGAFDRALADVERNMNQAKFGKAAEGLMRAVDAGEAFVIKASLGQNGFDIEGFVRDLNGGVKPVRASIVRDANFYKSIQDVLTSSLGAVAQKAATSSLGGPPKETADSVMKQSADVGEGVVIDPDKQIFDDLGDGKGDDSITGTWWFWTIVGVGTAAVAGAIAAVVINTSGDEANTGAVGNLQITLDPVGN